MTQQPINQYPSPYYPQSNPYGQQLQNYPIAPTPQNNFNNVYYPTSSDTIHSQNGAIADSPSLFQFVPPKPKPPIQQDTLIEKSHWQPSFEDRLLIDEWFESLTSSPALNSTEKQVGGVEAALFLKKSNLSKQVLRSIWSLVDSQNLGRVNREQFTTIIRLVSIHCSPIFAGSTPTLDRYYDTVDDTNITLPFALCEATIADRKGKEVDKAVSHAPLSPSPNSQATQANVHPSLNAPSFGSNRTTTEDDEEFSEFTEAAVSVPAAGLTLPSLIVPASVPATALAPTPSAMPAPDLLDFDEPFTQVEQLHQQQPQSDNVINQSIAHAQFSAPVDEDEFEVGTFQAFVQAEAVENPTPGLHSSSFLNPLVVAPADSTDEFDSFVAYDDPKVGLPPMAAESTNTRIEASKVKYPSTDTPATLPVASIPPIIPMNDRMSVFDELVEASVAEQEDWDEFAAADDKNSSVPITSVPVQVESAPPQVNASLLDFGDELADSGTTVLSVVNAPRPSAVEDLLALDWTHAPAPNILTQPKSVAEIDDDEDFGGFTEAITEKSSVTPIGQLSKESSDSFVMIGKDGDASTSKNQLKVEDQKIIAGTSAVGGNETEIDFGDDEDFGDFEQHQEVVPPPPAAPVVVDLLDFLSFESEPTPVAASSSFPSNSSSSFQANFAATFTNAVPLPNTPSPAASVIDSNLRTPTKTAEPQNILVADKGRQAVQDLSTFSPATEKILGSRFPNPDPKITTLNSHSSENIRFGGVVPDTPLSMDELDHLSRDLAGKHLYEEAYACARQVHLLRGISKLLDEKRLAMENSNFELAAKIKTDTARMAKLLEPQSQEAVWIAASLSDRTV